MDEWNVDDEWRRPFHSLTSDNAGNIYYAGFHFATEADGSTDIVEPDVDVFFNVEIMEKELGRGVQQLG